ncbi:serine hydrolase domain-containing protein [Haliscomenobacter sp.]|uniref:serine hydrolase domain-containing protein n=1 Tax=Haliscomenobacter sp. TaxID=2717303 RepID=UPI003BA90F67
MKNKTIWAFGLGLIFLFACKKEDDSITPEMKNRLDEQLTTAFKPVGNDTSVLGAILSVSIPKRGYLFEIAQGNATPTLAMQPKDQFFSASIGKVVTSALILKYADEGALKLDDPISKYLPVTLLAGLSVYKGVEYSGKITIRQLLNHTSGLPDFLLAGMPDAFGAPPFFQALFADVSKNWTSGEIIQFHKQNFPALAAPGQIYHYSDSNFHLLGLIAEALGKKPIHEIAYEKIFKTLNMTRTYYFFRENPRGVLAGREASWSFLGQIPLTFPAMSFDGPAGGLITCSEDLTKLLKGVVRGNFLSSASKTSMQAWIPTPEGFEYGLGLMNFEKQYGLDSKIIGHEGATNAIAFYVEQSDAYIVATYNQLATSSDNVNLLLHRVLEALKTIK